MRGDNPPLPTSPRWVQKCLDGLRLIPSKKKGQNFLLNNQVQKAIVEQAQLAPGDAVLEIGPGLGHLTQFILGRVKVLWAVEIDRRLAEFVARRFEGHPGFHVLHMDVLYKHKINPGLLKTLAMEEKTAFKIVANLPYSVATPVIMNFIAMVPPPDLMVITVQREVAERMIAQPSTPQYGHLSIHAQLYSSIEVIAQIAPRDFYPTPKVESTMIKITPKSVPENIGNPELLGELIKAAFQMRRKTVFNALRRGLNLQGPQLKEVLERCRISPARRPETISIDEFILLSNAMAGVS